MNQFVAAHGENCDDEQLFFASRDLITAGVNITTSTIRWAIVLLTNHDSVQKRAQAEIDSVVARQRLPSMDDRAQSVLAAIGVGKISRKFLACNIS